MQDEHLKMPTQTKNDRVAAYAEPRLATGPFPRTSSRRTAASVHRKVAGSPLDSGRGPDMPYYYAYHVDDDGHAVSRIDVHAENDDQAVAKVKLRLAGLHIEVWCVDRNVAVLRGQNYQD
jgi:hypothetical protein